MSGCVGAGAKFIAGPADLHELPGINGEAWGRQVIQDAKCSGDEPLLPVLFELADDIFYVIFINQEIAFHDGFHILPFFSTVQDLLLVMEGNLGVRDEEGWDEGMGNLAFRTEHTLEGKPDKDRIKFNGTAVMAMADEAALLAAGTFHLEELQSIHHTVILLLGKIIAIFKNKCYHILVGAQGSCFDSSAVWKRQDDFGWLWPVFFYEISFFSWLQHNDNAKGFGIQ